jgi:hypothetical protein
MGAAESTPSTSSTLSVKRGVLDPNFDELSSGVRITVSDSSSSSGLNNLSEAAISSTTEAKLKESYEKGREDGVNSFKSTLEQVAVQVYESVHSKLTEIQSESLKNSQATVIFYFVSLIVYVHIYLWSFS